MKKLFNINNLFLLVVFCLPLYLAKVNVFGAPSNVLELLVLLAIILSFFQKKEILIQNLLALPKLLTASCFLILLGLFISVFSNENYLTGLGIIKGWFVIPMLFSFALYSTLDSEIAIEKIISSIYLSTVVVSSLAIIYKVLGVVTFDNRLSAFYLSPNHLAMYLSPGIFFGLYFLLKSYLKDGFSKKTILHLFLLSVISVPLYFTFSYGAWTAVVFSLFCLGLILLSNKKNIFLVFSFAIILLAFLFVSQQGSEKFDTLLSSRSSLSSRITIWQVSSNLIAINPIVGIGAGNFQRSYLSLQKNYPPYLEWAVPQPHNIFLAFWLQTGMIGLMGFLFLLFFVFQSILFTVKNKKNTAMAVSLFGFFLYTLLHGLIDTTYWKNDLSFLFWICVFLTLFLRRNSNCLSKENASNMHTIS